MSIKIEVWGDSACFTRPELKSERVSYDVLIPSAARGILESIYWHPGVQYHIDKIHVLNPIKHATIRMNEVGDVISGKTVIDKMKKGEFVGMIPSECRQQRTTRYLQDVHYVIEAHFTLTNEAEPNTTPAKVFNILQRRIRKGQCPRQPFFGSSEHVAHFREWEGGEIPAIQESRDFGLVSFGLDYSDPDNPKPQYFYCTMENGVIRVPHVSEVLM